MHRKIHKGHDHAQGPHPHSFLVAADPGPKAHDHHRTNVYFHEHTPQQTEAMWAKVGELRQTLAATHKQTERDHITQAIARHIILGANWKHIEGSHDQLDVAFTCDSAHFSPSITEALNDYIGAYQRSIHLREEQDHVMAIARDDGSYEIRANASDLASIIHMATVELAPSETLEFKPVRSKPKDIHVKKPPHIHPPTTSDREKLKSVLTSAIAGLEKLGPHADRASGIASTVAEQEKTRMAEAILSHRDWHAGEAHGSKRSYFRMSEPLPEVAELAMEKYVHDFCSKHPEIKHDYKPDSAFGTPVHYYVSMDVSGSPVGHAGHKMEWVLSCETNVLEEIQKHIVEQNKLRAKKKPQP